MRREMVKPGIFLAGILGIWLLLLVRPEAQSSFGVDGVPARAQAAEWISETASESALSPATAHGSPPYRVDYRITARLDAKAHRVSGTLSLVWRNPSGLAADRLPFHLYLNAFSHGGTRFMDFSWRHRYPGRSPSGGWGGITVQDVQVDGEPARAVDLEDDGTVMQVTPARPVEGKAEARIALAFEAQLPKIRARTGYSRDFHLVGQWFPKLGVRGADGAWHCEPFHALSEFYADFGSYDVTIEVPAGFDVAATGERQLDELVGKPNGAAAGGPAGTGGRRFRYVAAPVHDFAWVATRGLKRQQRRLGGITLEVVHVGEPAPVALRHLDHMVKALDRLQRWFGPYPYPVLTGVLVPPHAEASGGMEYPTFFTSMASHPPFLERMGPLNTTVHELVHQYFHGLLASNELEEPWLDEGFTTYVTGLVLDDLYGAHRSALELGPLRLGYFSLVRIWYRMLPSMDPPGRRAPGFSSPQSYFMAVYARSALALRTLQGRIGLDAMLALLADYVRRFRFRHPRGEDFLRILDAHVADPSLRRFFREAISTDGVLHYAVESIQTRPIKALQGRFAHDDARRRREARDVEIQAGLTTLNRVLLARRGALRLPVPLVLRFADGSTLERWWDGEARWHWMEVPHRHALLSAEIDPCRTLVLERRLLDSGRLVRPDARPARRLAGRLLVGLQVAMQTVGL